MRKPRRSGALKIRVVGCWLEPGGPMRKLTLILALALAGCVSSSGEMTAIYKPGSSFAQRSAAFDQCKIASLREIPQTMQTDTTGGYYNPGTLQCSTNMGMTTCNRIGAVNIPSSSVTYDANEGLRVRYIIRCLNAQGYSMIPTRRCNSDAERKAAKANLVSQSPTVACVDNPTLDRGLVF